MKRKTAPYVYQICLRGVCLCATLLPLVLLVWMLRDLALSGIPRVGIDFLQSFPSRKAELAGILPALVGSLYLIALTIVIALPLGFGAAIYLEEYGKDNRFAGMIEVNITNLAGVPSIIYGLLGLEVFVRMCGMGRSILAGAATLSLLMLPILITSSREALRCVPLTIREAGQGLGASPLAVIRHLVLPAALPSMLTGSILAVSRAIGETAPLIVVGALAYMAFLPDSLNSPFTALPIQIFNWVSRPQADFAINAAAGILVLLMTLLCLNGFALWLRNRYET